MSTNENIHVRSFRDFIQRRLPEALAKVIPLTEYKADWTSESRGRVSFSVGTGGPRLTFDDLPFPRPDGSFISRPGDHPRCVVMTADSNDLERATIKAVGEQLVDVIAPRLVEPPNGGTRDEDLLRAWFPLGQWLEELLLGPGMPSSQWMDVTNPVAQATHLRRIMLLGGDYTVSYWPHDPYGNYDLVGGDVSSHPSQIGRVDPVETPEGPKVGRVLTLARGAEVRDGKIVPAPDHAESTLGLSSSLVPLLCHNDTSRQLMGVNMIRQAVPPGASEPPLVRSGLEPEDGSAFLGRNLLTAFLHWKGMTYEDAIVVSESAAKRLASPPWVAEVGDKLSNRHGTKGVIGAVLPDEEMPHLPDGRAVDLIFDANGLYSRLNFGQVLEATLGLVAHARGEAITMAPFRRTTPEEVHGLLREARLPESGQVTLRDGKDGAELDGPTTVGYVYWYRLVHTVRTKIHAFAPGFQERGGQRAGEMEITALRAMGAYESILEALSTRARTPEELQWEPRYYGAGLLGEHLAPPSPAFRRLQRALRVGGVAMEFAAGAGAYRLPSGEGADSTGLDLATTDVAVRFGWTDDGELVLAGPVEHPWRPGTQLTHLSRPDNHADEYERVVAANARLTEAPSEQAQAGLQKAVTDLLDAVREDCRVRYGERGLFTARSVLAPGYDLRIDQLGLPEDIAWPLFAPLLSGWAWEAIDERGDRQKTLIEDLMRESVVVLNRAPTLETTAIAAFQPVLVAGRSILLHPLCCRMFNGDYDGDQAAVWMPVTKPGQAEAKEKLTVLAHLKRDPSVMMYHLTPGGGVLMGLAYALDFPEGQEQFAALWPAGTEAPGAPLTRDLLVARLLAAYDTIGAEALLELLDGLYRMGITWATRSGYSFSPFAGEGLKLPPAPTSHYAASWHLYAQIVETELAAQGDSDPSLRGALEAIRSGARGSFRQLRAVVGPWAGDHPYYGPGPVKHGFRDGLEPEEYWVLAERTRRQLQQLDRQYTEAGYSVRSTSGLHDTPTEASVLRRALVAHDAAAAFAEAADKGETDPLTDPDVRLWVGLRP
jgi:hypothetical protein